MAQADSPACKVVCELNHLLHEIERPRRQSSKRTVTTGCRPVDQLLQCRGFNRGSLVEWLSDGPGSGASTLAMIAAREASRDGGMTVVVDRSGAFYPPAAAVWRIDLQNTIVVRPQNDKDEQWALDQALRCEYVAAVAAWPRQLDSHTFRRLQLAAEASGCLGVFVRPLAARYEPSWADVRLLVSPRPSQQGWRLHVQLLRCRGRFGEGEIELEINDRTGEIDEAHSGSLVPQLARSAFGKHSA